MATGEADFYKIDSDTHAYLLYDGDCGVCSRLAGLLEKMDASHDFIIKPYRSFTEDELRRHRLSYEKCSKRAYAVGRGGRVYGGAFALNYFFLKRFPWSLLVILIYGLPPLLVAELIGYYLVARNRYRISRWLGLEACKVES
jgi:predicted DCC family thiol-disulfide oxidoreductase YuxK